MEELGLQVGDIARSNIERGAGSMAGEQGQMQAVGGAENLLLPSKRRARVALLDVGVVICGRENKIKSVGGEPT